MRIKGITATLMSDENLIQFGGVQELSLCADSTQDQILLEAMHRAMSQGGKIITFHTADNGKVVKTETTYKAAEKVTKTEFTVNAKGEII